MENENKPQQDGQKPDSAPLTAKKKRALLEYLAILCAGAFLIVALSLGIKLISVQNDMEAANRGAQNLPRSWRRPPCRRRTPPLIL